jgi:hypothetical protein
MGVDGERQPLSAFGKRPALVELPWRQLQLLGARVVLARDDVEPVMG